MNCAAKVDNGRVVAHNHGLIQVGCLRFGLAVDANQVQVVPNHLLDEFDVEHVLAGEHNRVGLVRNAVDLFNGYRVDLVDHVQALDVDAIALLADEKECRAQERRK